MHCVLLGGKKPQYQNHTKPIPKVQLHPYPIKNLNWNSSSQAVMIVQKNFLKQI